jgi:importin subunit beta-1
MQINDTNFAQIVEECFTSTSAEIRTRDEALIMQYQNESADAFVNSCAREFQNSGLPTFTRVLISTTLKSALRPIDSEHGKSIWLRIQPESKQKIKDGALSCLIDKNELVKKSAASLTAVVFVLDATTDKQWGMLLDILATNIGSEQPEIKKAAIMTLGYICELLNSDKITDLSSEKVDTLLSGICIGLKGYSEISNTAVNALWNSIKFLKTNIQNEGLSDFIIDLLITLLMQSSQAKDEETTRSILLCLGDIIKLIFDKFQKYSAITFQKVTECYSMNSDSVTLALNEFFMKLMKLEAQQRTTYFENHWNNILKITLEILYSRSKGSKDDDDEGLSVPESILMLLVSINGLFNKQSFEFLIGFISEHIENPQENSKITALIALESILENTHSNIIYDSLNARYFCLLNYLANGSSKLKERTARLLLKISVFHPSVIFNDQNFSKSMQEFGKILSSESKSSSTIKLKIKTCEIIESLAQNASGIQNGSVQISVYVDPLFAHFTRNIQTVDNLHLVGIIFSTIFSILQNIVEPKALNYYFLFFTEFLGQIYQNFQGSLIFKKYIIESIFSTQAFLFTRMGQLQIQLTVPKKETHLYLHEMFSFIANIFTAYNEILAEGLVLASSIVCYNPSYFAQHIDQFIKSFVLPSLQNFNNYELFKAGLEVSVSLSKHFSDNFQVYVNDMVVYLLSMLQNQSLGKEIKLNIFYTFSDLTLAYPAIIVSHFEEIIRLILLALSAIVHLLTLEDREMKAYGNSLKDSLIDFYTCLIHAIYLNSPCKDQQFEESFVQVQTFLKITCQPSHNPSVEYMKNSLGLIIDFYSKNQMRNLLDVELSMYLYNSLSVYSKGHDVQMLLEFAKKYLDSL